MKTCFAAAMVGAAMLVGTSAGLVAQELIPQLPREGRMDAQSVTVVGCVAKGAAVDTYNLTNIAPAPEDKDKDKDAMKSLTLALAGTEVDLSQHVGHKVSLTGTREAKLAGAIGTTGTDKPSVEAPKDKTVIGTFTVKSLTMVAPTCDTSSD